MDFFVISSPLSVIFWDSRETEKNRERNLKFGSVLHGTNLTLSVLKLSHMPRTPTFGNDNHPSFKAPKLYENCAQNPLYIFFFVTKSRLKTLVSTFRIQYRNTTQKHSNAFISLSFER